MLDNKNFRKMFMVGVAAAALFGNEAKAGSYWENLESYIHTVSRQVASLGRDVANVGEQVEALREKMDKNPQEKDFGVIIRSADLDGCDVVELKNERLYFGEKIVFENPQQREVVDREVVARDLSACQIKGTFVLDVSKFEKLKKVILPQGTSGVLIKAARDKDVDHIQFFLNGECFEGLKKTLVVPDNAKNPSGEEKEMYPDMVKRLVSAGRSRV